MSSDVAPIVTFDGVTVGELLSADLSIAPGITAITGPSGAGKTTVLRLLTCFTDPSSGHIRVFENDLASVDPVEHRRSVTMLTQAPWVGYGTIRESLAVLGEWRNEPQPSDDEMRTVLTTLGLSHELDTDARTLSGGEQQRLAAARLILSRPRLALLDEPTAALDQAGARTFLTALLCELRSQGASVIFVIHDERLLDLADHHLVLQCGKLSHASSVFDSRAAESMSEPSERGEQRRGEPLSNPHNRMSEPWEES
ncbi:MAG: ATP-binding cassette domain-containing protein [Actinomycetaceae bacterium]|nr:ATP-binding cassette domain-containing protein [Actinomycetaceae bacterium]